jgi:hypothetical protein
MYPSFDIFTVDTLIIMCRPILFALNLLKKIKTPLTVIGEIGKGGHGHGRPEAHFQGNILPGSLAKIDLDVFL